MDSRSRTILNLFIGIIVSTMQELALVSGPDDLQHESLEVLERIETDLSTLKQRMSSGPVD